MRYSLLFLTLLGCLVATPSVLAQITTDGTTPTTLSLTPCGTTGTCNIGGGITAGSNLFHSFSQFNLSEGATANFVNPNVFNIITRVTGGIPSNLLGTLAVGGGSGTANLFFLNPNGIIFGPNARLSTNGSFLATTANAFKFPNGVFSANLGESSNPSILTVNPSALLFNQMATPAPIINRSRTPNTNPRAVIDGLRAGDGKSLALVGGDVTLDGGGLTVLNGLIQVGGLAQTGEVSISYFGNIPRFNIDQTEGNRRANVVLTNQASIDADAGGGGLGNGGGIGIYAKAITLDQGSQVGTDVFNLGNPGLIFLQGTDSVSISNNSRISSQLEETAIGNLGIFAGGAFNEGDDLQASIVIETNTFSLSNNSQINTTTAGIGNAGAVGIIARDRATLSNGSTILSAVSPGAIGNGGAVLMKTGSLTISNGGGLSTETNGIGSGGIVRVIADQDITLTGNNATSGQLPTGILSTATTRASGSGGLIQLLGNNLNLSNGAEISVSSEGRGRAGDIDILLNNQLLMNRGKITAESREVGGGNIFIGANQIRLSNSSLISTSVFDGTGGGGDILIFGYGGKESLLVAIEDSDILAAAERGPGGNIIIRNMGLVADLFAAVPKDFVDARIFRGNGRVDISASSRFGKDGVVDVPDVTALENALATLSDNIIDPNQLIANSCIARRNAQQGSFTVTGTGGLPRTPEDGFTHTYDQLEVQPLPQPNNTSEPIQPQSSLPPWQLGQPIIEAQGLIAQADGRIIAGVLPSALPLDPWCR